MKMKMKKKKEMKEMKYYTADREAGNRIECFDTKEEAMKAIKRYEQEDRDEGIYVENFYDVEEEGDE